MTRAPRAKTQATERRRRKSMDAMQDLKMEVPQGVRDTYPEHVFRWINDVGNRVYNKTVKDDWDKVEESLCPSMPVGTNAAGQPIVAHLYRKLRVHHEADQAEAMAERVERQNQLMRSAAPDPQSNPEPQHAYAVPGNTVTQGYSP